MLPPAFEGGLRAGRQPVGGFPGGHNPGVAAGVADGGGDPRPGDVRIRVDTSREAGFPPSTLPPAFRRAMVSAERVPVLKALLQYARFRGGTALGGYRYFVADPAWYTRVPARRQAPQALYDRLTPQRRSSYVAPIYGRDVSTEAAPSYDIRDTGTSPRVFGKYARAMRITGRSS